MGRTDERFRTAGTREPVDPDDGQMRFGFHGVRDFEMAQRAKAEGYRRHGTEFQEIASANASAAQHFVLGFLWVEHGYILFVIQRCRQDGSGACGTPPFTGHDHSGLAVLVHTESVLGVSVNRMIARYG